jgi:hypothetical protein
VLAYCIAEQRSQIDVPPRGVEGAPVKSIDTGVLRCFASDFGSRMPDEPVPKMVRAFNEVLRRIFSQAAIIPFRFPTIVESEDVLTQFVESRSAEYMEALQRLRDKVQMDVRITVHRMNRPLESASQSGKGYLEARKASHQQAQSILEQFRRVSDSHAEEWTQRETGSGIRGFALVTRSSLPLFLEEIARVVMPDGISARVTGPWPPSEFVETTNE